MPLLSNREASDVTDAFLLTLYGERTFTRWNNVKCHMQFNTESDYVNWVLDVVENYASEGAEAAVEVEEINEDVKTEYGEGARHFERSDEPVGKRRRVKYEEQLVTVPQTESGVTWPGSADNMHYTEQADHGSHETELVTNTRKWPTVLFEQTNHDISTHDNKAVICSDYSDTNQDDTATIDIRRVAVEDEDGCTPAIGYPRSKLLQHTPMSESDGVKRRRPHSCYYCDYSTVNKADLTKHVLAVHKRIKPHECPHCMYRSATKSNLFRHVKLRHGSGTVT